MKPAFRHFLIAFALVWLYLSASKLLFSFAVGLSPDHWTGYGTGIKVALPFDLATAAWLYLSVSLVLLLLPGRRRGVYLTVWGVALFLPLFYQTMDTIYYLFAHKHLTVELDGGYDSPGSYLVYLWRNHLGLTAGFIALYGGTLVALGAFAYPRWSVPGHRLSWRRSLAQRFAILLLCFVSIRGVDAEVLHPLLIYRAPDRFSAEFGYSPTFSLVYRSLRRDLVIQKERKTFYTPVVPPEPSVLHQHFPARGAGAGMPRRANVVLILLERWSAEFLRTYGGEGAPTPFFDRLREKGLSPHSMFTHAARTAQGVFAVNCSLQNPVGRYIAEDRLAYAPYRCLTHILRDAGWQTAFFQGTRSNLVNVGTFVRAIGFDESYGFDELSPSLSDWAQRAWTGRSDLTNSYGLFDQDLYRAIEQKVTAGEIREPFLIAINTNTTHDLVLPPGESPHFPGKDRTTAYLNTLYSADQALKGFYERFQDLGLSGDTYFVITGDHTGAATATTNLLRRSQVPFVMVGPGLAPQRIPIYASHRDVAPTILDVLGAGVPAHFHGYSLRDPGYQGNSYFISGRSAAFSFGPRGAIAHVPTGRLEACFDLEPDAQPARRCGWEDRLRRDVFFHYLQDGQKVLENEQTRQARSAPAETPPSLN